MRLKRTVNGDTVTLSDAEGAVLTIAASEEGNDICLSLKGELRSDTKLDFRDELMFSVLSYKKVILDMKELSYIAPGCQRALLEAQKQADAKDSALLLRSVTAEVCKQLEETGLYALLAYDE